MLCHTNMATSGQYVNILSEPACQFGKIFYRLATWDILFQMFFDHSVSHGQLPGTMLVFCREITSAGLYEHV